VASDNCSDKWYSAASDAALQEISRRSFKKNLKKNLEKRTSRKEPSEKSLQKRKGLPGEPRQT